MKDKEIIFVIEEEPDGGYCARALNDSIVTQADQLNQMHDIIRDAVRCHFDEGKEPKVIHLHFVRDETIAL